MRISVYETNTVNIVIFIAVDSDSFSSQKGITYWSLMLLVVHVLVFYNHSMCTGTEIICPIAIA